MKRYLLAAVAVAAFATPAAARDNSGYFGIEVGALFANDHALRDDGVNVLDINYKMGVDGDLIAGYDWGLIRGEAELAYKRAEHDEYGFRANSTTVDADGRTSVYSAMANLLLDFGNEESANFYVGAGAGIAWGTLSYEPATSSTRTVVKDTNLAWQGIAGVRVPVWTHFDVGLKYRYFDAGRISDDTPSGRLSSRFNSHSLLASLIYNFAPPPPPPLPPAPPLPPPPPPPPPPATQTCADGRVIVATDNCPLPPPPPPPPAPAPERG